MKKLIYISLTVLWIACSSIKKSDNCDGKILDLLNITPNDTVNKILNYLTMNNLMTINDTNQLMRFAEQIEISYYFQPSKLDSTKRKYTLFVKEGIIKTKYYQMDLLIRKDNDVNGDNLLCWLKTYDNNRKEIDHLDFAFKDSEGSHGGRIDCDTTLHRIYGKDQSVFKISETGKNMLIKL